MLIRNDLTNPGLYQICDGEADKMFMNIYYLNGEKGKTYTFQYSDEEAAFLLLNGQCHMKTNKNNYSAERKNCFYDSAFCLHVSKNIFVQIECDEPCEILIQCKENEKDFEEVWYDENSINDSIFGVKELKETTTRRVTTIIDKDRAPYSNMVLGEVINLPGIWASYPPHHHPQPEVYFYKFDRPQGFGTSFIGEDAYKIYHNSISFIDGGLTHPQNAAPGYAMYYVWMIPHLENNPWIRETITFDPDHEWVSGDNLSIYKLKEEK